MTNLEKYEQIFCNTFHVDKERLYDNFTFEAVGEWDSLIHLSLITDIEDTFAWGGTPHLGNNALHPEVIAMQ